MNNWKINFKYDPVSPLINSTNKAIVFFAKRDLLNEDIKIIENISQFSEIKKITVKQLDNGSWKYQNKINNPKGINYFLFETFKQLRTLIDQYELNRSHNCIKQAADFIFKCQSNEGDIRGLLANQYAPCYTGAILYLLVKAGFENNPNINNAFHWLLKMRQNDGGWVFGSPGLIGISTLSKEEIKNYNSNLEYPTMSAFDSTKPFSASATGMILRAFSVHPAYKKSQAAIKAARLLKSIFFKKDHLSSKQTANRWLKFQFPFYQTNLISALDTLSLLNFPAEDQDIKSALNWIIENQQEDGLWKLSYSKAHKTHENDKTYQFKLWITLSICRIFKRFFN